MYLLSVSVSVVSEEGTKVQKLEVMWRKYMFCTHIVEGGQALFAYDMEDDSRFVCMLNEEEEEEN